jgi:hypothetical protein
MNALTFDCPDSFYHHAEILLNHGVIFYGVTATLTIVLLTGEDI